VAQKTETGLSLGHVFSWSFLGGFTQKILPDFLGMYKGSDRSAILARIVAKSIAA